MGLATAEKPESQEICFVPDGDYAAAVERIRPDRLPGEGDIVDGEGKRVGRHAGVHRFTVGQRRGLGIATGDRVYVTRIDAAKNRVVVGEHDDLLTTRAELEGVNWIAGEVPTQPVTCQVRIRYRHAGAEARVIPEAGGRARVEFTEPVAAVAPGQAAVFDQGDVVLGGGWIADAGS
jgi:tRNA-specific 2-thiouridylase